MADDGYGDAGMSFDYEQVKTQIVEVGFCLP